MVPHRVEMASHDHRRALSRGAAEQRVAIAGAAGDAGLPSSEQQVELMKLQRLQEKQKEMFNTVSAILRMQHETRSAIIGNIR